MKKILIISLIILAAQLSTAQVRLRRSNFKVDNVNHTPVGKLEEFKDVEDYNKRTYELLQQNLIKSLDEKQTDLIRKNSVKDTVVLTLDFFLNKKGETTNFFIRDYAFKNILENEVTATDLIEGRFIQNKDQKDKLSDTSLITYDLLFVLERKSKSPMVPIAFETLYDIPKRMTKKNFASRVFTVSKECAMESNPEECFYNQLQEGLLPMLENTDKDIILGSVINKVIFVYYDIYTDRDNILQKDLTRFGLFNAPESTNNPYCDLIEMVEFATLDKSLPSNIDYVNSYYRIFYKVYRNKNGDVVLKPLPYDYQQRILSNDIRSTDDPDITVGPIHPDCDAVTNYASSRNCLQKILTDFVVNNFISLSYKEMENREEQKISLVLQFDTEGDLKILRTFGGTDLFLIEEAIRVMKKFPKLNPAVDNEGNPIRMRTTLPIIIQKST